MPTGRRSNAPSEKPHTNKNIKIPFVAIKTVIKHFIYKGAAAIATLSNSLFHGPGRNKRGILHSQKP
jgi:hypothetical protein